jgi:hypothetical protein
MARARASNFLQLQQQARRLLMTLREKIRSREIELQGLKDEASSVSRLAGGPARVRTAAGVAKRAGRIDWRAVLARLPKQFKAVDIRKIPGLRKKRLSELFAAITRWIDAGLVKRKARGLYVRLTEPHKRNSKKPA